jgi:hypothetical protein
MPNEFIVKNGLIVGGNVVTSGTITINGALAATQSWVTSQAYLTSASLSGYATQSYVTSALAALVDAAPAALDTLNELAAALGDDASFSTTITNSIASKQAQLNGTGLVRMSGTSVSYDNTTYLVSNFGNIEGDHSYGYPSSDGWYKIAEVVFNGSCQSYNLWGEYRDTGYFDNSHYRIHITARAECDFPTNNESHAINVNMYGSSTNETYFNNNVRVVLTSSSSNYRKYELQYYRATWDTGSWNLQTLGWTTYTTSQTAGTPTGTARVYYISKFVADNIYAANKISIGTTYSGFAANIAGTTYVIGASVWVNDGYGISNASSGGTGFFPYSDGTLVFNSVNSEKMRIAPSGNVGIGTNSPSALLDVNGRVIVGGGLNGNAFSIATSIGTYTFNNYNLNTPSSFLITAGSSGYLSLDGYPIIFKVLGSETMRVHTSGNIGIGTDSPTHLLSLSRATQAAAYQLNINNAGGISDGNFTGIRFSQDSNAATELGNIKLHYYSTGATDLSFGTRYSPTALYIQSGGNVGIGTTGPREKLQIVGNTVIGSAGLNSYKTNLYLTYNAGSDETWVRIYVPQDYNSSNNGGTIRVRVLWEGDHATFGAYQDYQISYKTFYPSSPYLKFSNVLCTNKTSDFATGSTYYLPSSTPDVLFYDNTDGYLYVKVKGTHTAYNTARYIEAEIFGRTTAQPTIATTSAPGAPVELTKTIQFLPQEGNIYASGSIGIGTTSPNQKLSVEGGSIQLNANNAAANYYLFLNKKSGQDGGILFNRDNASDWQLTNGSGNGDLIFYSYGTGTEAITFKRGTGYVGIGTTSPDNKLTVKGDNALIDVQSTADGQTIGFLARYLNSATLGGAFRYTTGDAQLYIDNFYQGNNGVYSDINIRNCDTVGNLINRIKIKGSNGNVGIGTSSPGWKLHVAGESYTSGVVRIGGTNPFYFEDYGGGWFMSDSTWVRTSNSKSVWVGGGLLGGDGGLTIGYGGTGSPSGGAIIAGNVGIGTSSPGAKLHVVGKSIFENNMRIYPASESWAEGLSFIMPTTVNWGGLRWQRQRGNSDGNWYVGFTALDSTDDLVFGANNGGSQVDNIIRLTKAGKVGIGTSTPAEELHVIGRGIFNGGSGNSSTDAVVYITKSTNDDWGLYVNNAGLDYGTYTRVSPSANYALAIHNGTTWTTRITGNAIIYLGEKNAIEGNYDSWLRLNNSSQYASGVYTPGVMRADGGFNVSGSTVWHAGNDGSGSGLDADLLDGQNSTEFLRLLSGGAEASLDSYTDNGIRSVNFTGHSQHLLSWNAGGSTGTVQQLFHYGTSNNGWRIRNKTDNSSWSDWGYVVMASSNQGLISGTIATQSWVGSQSYATTSYVTTQINNLINGAPGVLDTLDELAAALGDDSNFATTVTNSIAGKVSKAGDTMTGNINWDTQNTGLTWNMNTDGAYIKFFNTGDGDTNSRLEYSTSDNGDEFHRWVIAGVEKMNLKWGGLTVTDTIYASGGNSGNWNTAYGWGNHASAGYALNSSLANYLPLSGGVIGGGVTINGNLTVNGTITENSSIKLKENIETSEGNLEKVVNLRPVTYNKIGSQTTELGLIAEEVAEVYPEFVQYDENGEPIGVHYSRLTAALIGAVKELTNQVQELNKKING